ncbi:MAG: putative peptidoglycan glycosyltransferase FtsW [Chlamydiia bacterium]|nr:putative peptidoglycan glycosyltransferase FtsW [Chlamydiia bacterium]
MNYALGWLYVSVMTLLMLGAMMVYNTTSADLILKFHSGLNRALIKHGVTVVIGVGFASLFYFLGYKRLIAYSPWLMVGINLLLLMVFIPKLGMQINGAHRWMRVFGISFQPSEFAKIILPAYFIHSYLQIKKDLSFWKFFKMMLMIGIPLFLILIEPDNGTVAVMIVTLATLCFVAHVRWTYWVLPLVGLILVGGVVASQMKHVPDRIRIYLNPELDLLGKGHQPYQAKIASGSGKLFGRGLGESLQKLNYLPEARSDYIAAIYAEEMGYAGILFLLGTYMMFAQAGFYIATRAKDDEGYYLATVMTFLIVFQAFLNLGVVSGLLPSKGINLPFFSHGGCSLGASFSMVAILTHICLSKNREAALWNR